MGVEEQQELGSEERTDQDTCREGPVGEGEPAPREDCEDEHRTQRQGRSEPGLKCRGHACIDELDQDIDAMIKETKDLMSSLRRKEDVPEETIETKVINPITRL